jgi:hypothetical protein
MSSSQPYTSENLWVRSESQSNHDKHGNQGDHGSQGNKGNRGNNGDQGKHSNQENRGKQRNYENKGNLGNYRYLGSSVNCNNDNSRKVRKRILTANRCFYGLRNQLKSQILMEK